MIVSLPRAVAVVCAVVGLVLAGPAYAQDLPAEPHRTQARELAQQGDAAFKVGRCDKAIPLWQHANEHFPAPTILFRIARCQALLGRVVDASATLERVLALPDELNTPEAFREAKEQAAAELPAVRARIAYLSVVVDARALSIVPQVHVDDRTLAPQSSEFAIDPGSHVVRVRARDASWEQTVVLREGSHEIVRVAVGVRPAPQPARTQRAVGYVIGGLGLASLATGAVFAVSASTTARHLAGDCGSDRKQCPPGRQDDIDRLKTHATVADVTLGVGAALFAAGAIVVLTEPPPKSEAPRLVLFPVGLGAAVQGSF